MSDGVAVNEEITLIGRTNIYPNATEVMEAIMAMYQGAGLNVKLKMLEVAEWVDPLPWKRANIPDPFDTSDLMETVNHAVRP